MRFAKRVNVHSEAECEVVNRPKIVFYGHSRRPSKDELFFNDKIFKRKVGIHIINGDRKIKTSPS